ncbi:hypothetical protein GCM10025857_28200 [Alicyclobacillus contaminans]|uniref:hypothetical protein n=1 Tax=Alicyclobacillus contaminans TaxID=392016 RepID=UPI000683FE2C|nr:hypothetical protein [Alicyclobacillus contaminans]GMA51463.1 hypothetical protein GCM10025857_28200 [Alicyclobacillus contaminans]
MANHSARNVRITGTSESSGGRFQRLTVLGDCTFHGAVECKSLRGMGEVEVNGNLTVGGLRMMGNMEVHGNLEVTTANVLGEMQVSGDCTGDVLTLRGAFNVDGLLSADDLRVKLYGPSRVRDMGGASLVVRKRYGKAAELVAEVIEGDEVNLQFTTAEVVRGRRVVLGRGCRVKRVEYQDVFEQNSDAVVEEAVQLH